jgi:sugar lactone lactonase YvrE
MPSGETVGVSLDREGRILCAEQGSGRQVSRGKAPAGMPGFDQFEPFLTESPGGPLGGVAGGMDTPKGKFNRPNDITVSKNGTIYFTDPWFSGSGPDYPLGQTHQGVFRASPDGKTIVAEAFLTD